MLSSCIYLLLSKVIELACDARSVKRNIQRPVEYVILPGVSKELQKRQHRPGFMIDLVYVAGLCRPGLYLLIEYQMIDSVYISRVYHKPGLNRLSLCKGWVYNKPRT